MTEAAGLAIRWLQFLSGVWSAGVLLYALLPVPSARAYRASHLGPALAWACLGLACACATAMASLAIQVASVSGMDVESIRPPDLRAFVAETHAGHVWLWREALAAALLTMMGVLWVLHQRQPSDRRPLLILVAVLVLGYQAMIAMAGHGAGSDAAVYAVGIQALHVAASSAWLGGLLLLAFTAWRAAATGHGNGVAFATRLRAFSILATACMAALAASGTWLAWKQIGGWPALFGTRYGTTMLAKLACLCAVLAAAGHLRWRLLPRLEAAFGSRRGRRSVATWLLLELACALALSWFAVDLGNRVPALHDDIEWMLPIRLAPTAAVALPDAPVRLTTFAVLAGLGLACVAFARARRSLAGRAIAAVTLPGALAAGLWALAVPAFPDTYRRSPVPYQAVSVAAGQALFRERCVACHGEDATGHGPAARTTPRPPADLTAPHSADHTPGDLYWWLTHGIPAGGMPEFSTLSREARWDLVNYLHTLSRSYQARVLRERIVPGRPWLGAPDFDYVDANGTNGTLKDFRGRSAVLIAMYTTCASAARIARIEAFRPQLEARGVAVLVVPAGTTGRDACGQPARAAEVREGNDAIETTYSMFRHTLENLRPTEGPQGPAHLEFLIDRFGYVRARWLPEDTQPGWDDPAVLFAQVDRLAAESEILPPPDEHLH